MRKIWLKPERTGDKTENFVPLWRRIAPFSINLFPAIPDTTITKKCRPLKEWTDRVRAFVTYKKNRARMIFLCFVSEAYKKKIMYIFWYPHVRIESFIWVFLYVVQSKKMSLNYEKKVKIIVKIMFNLLKIRPK